MKIAKEALDRATKTLLANSVLDEKSCRKLAELAIQAAAEPSCCGGARTEAVGSEEYALIKLETQPQPKVSGCPMCGYTVSLLRPDFPPIAQCVRCFCVYPAPGTPTYP